MYLIFVINTVVWTIIDYTIYELQAVVRNKVNLCAYAPNDIDILCRIVFISVGLRILISEIQDGLRICVISLLCDAASEHKISDRITNRIQRPNE